MTAKEKLSLLAFSAVIAALTAWYIASHITPTAPKEPRLDEVVAFEAEMRHLEELRKQAENAPNPFVPRCEGGAGFCDRPDCEVCQEALRAIREVTP